MEGDYILDDKGTVVEARDLATIYRALREAHRNGLCPRDTDNAPCAVCACIDGDFSTAREIFKGYGE